MKPNVLHLIDSFREGGSERQAVQLARLLDETGRYSIRIACLNNDGPLRRELGGLEAGNIRCYPLNRFYDHNSLIQIRRLSEYLREEKIDILHTHCFYTNVFGIASGALARSPARIASRRESNKRSAPKRIVERAAYRRAHRIIANCEEVRRQLIEEGIPSEKIETVYNGVDSRRLDQSGLPSRVKTLESLKLPSFGSHRFVAILANIREVKDHATFLRAARRVCDEIPDAVFVLAGGGPLIEPMRLLAKKLGLERETFFLGRCDNVAELLNISDVCVLSSRSEGFSNAILEYMAAGKPIVSTDVGGIREATGDGEAGYLVPAGDEASMAKHITYLLRHPEEARAMGERGRAIVERRFSCENQLNQIETLYDRLLSAARDRAGSRQRNVNREGEYVH